MLDINTLPKTFLGANAAGGFCSRFYDCYVPEDNWSTYIIKGGPGTGKSSMMKQLAALFLEQGIESELCPCSSDPDSLDAIIIKDKKSVVLDGTSPHTVDPQYPGVCETIINLSDCWDPAAFSGKEKEIIALTRQNKAHHKRASRYITAAGSLLSDTRLIADEYVDRKKLERYLKRISATIERGDGFKEHQRFISGITPKGLIFYKSTIKKLCDTIIAVSDEYGAVSAQFMKLIYKCAKEKQCEIYVFYNFLQPDVIDHIIFPALRLGFCAENSFCHPEGITRRIHARRFLYTISLKEKQNRLSFNQNASEELLREAVSVLTSAKSVHDELEGYYISAMDFTRVGALTQKIYNEIIKK